GDGGGAGGAGYGGAVPRSGEARAARAFRRRRGVSNRRGAAARRAAAAALRARRRAGRRRLRSAVCGADRPRRTGGPSHHRGRNRAEHRRDRSGVRRRGGSDLRARAGGKRAPRAHRADGSHALQPDAQELESVRPGPDGVRADDHLVAHDRDLADAREGNGHDGGTPRLAAAALADHLRQSRAVPGRRFHRGCRRDHRGAPRVQGAAAGERHAPARRRAALHPRLPVARHPGLRAHVVSTRRDDGRAHRHDAADDAAVGIHFSAREHAAAAARDLGRGAGAVVRPRRTQHHAERDRAVVPVAAVARADGARRRAARREHAGVSRTAGGVVMRRILFLARAEALHVVRDRATLAQVLVVPVVQLLVLSNAATFQIRNTPTYVVDLDRSTTSRGLVERFAASGHFRVDGQSASQDVANEALVRGDVTMVLTIPQDFEASLARTAAAPIQLTVNAEKGSAAGIVQSYASNIVAAYAGELESRHPARRGPAAREFSRAVIDVHSRNWYNPTLNYKHYMVPGILVALVTLIGTLLTAQNIAREKELGTLEQLNATPITRGQFIAAKLLPFWILGLIDLTIGLIVGRVVFGVPMRGSVLLLFGSAALYLVTALAIGLWISTLVETQQQAMFVTFFIMNVYLL